MNSIIPDTVCYGATVILTATVAGGSNGDTVRFFDNGTLLGPASLSGGIATLSASSLTAGVHNSITATYLGNDNANPSSSSARWVTVNALPTAPDKTVRRAPGTSVKIAIADTGAAGSGAVSFSSVSGGSQRATIIQDGSYIYYSPQPGNDSDDSFAYTTTDDNCASPAGTITVRVQVAAGGLAREITYSAGGVTVVFAGIPGVAYDVQRLTTADFQSHTVLSTTNAPPAGVFTITDDAPLSPSGYYRLLQH